MSATHTDFLRHLRSVMANESISGFPDQQLLQMFRNQRSQAAFAALVQRHGPMVFGVCRRLLRHSQDAEDAFQAVFLSLARQAASIRRQEALGSWLYGVACRIVAKMKRASARRIVHEGHLSPRPPGDTMEVITWRELRSALDEELQRLPEKHRVPLVLCYLEARTQDEAARQLGWSKNTFTRRLNQARQLLAQRLTRRGLTLPAAVTAPLLLDAAAEAALPPLLAANTVRAGLASAMGQATALRPDRVVHLRIEGPRIEYRNVTAMTRPDLTKGMPPDWHGPTFDHLAAPSKPIRGTVREKGTGKPLAGAHVYSGDSDTVITDRAGHYEIPGVRKSETYFVGAFGPSIISHAKEAKDTPGLQPVTVDLEVERGLVLRVRATEKGSGKPVRGFVLYAVRSDNREIDRYTTFGRNVVSWCGNEKDGTYEQVVLPGPAYIAFRAFKEHYVRKRLEKKTEDPFLTGILPGPQSMAMFHAFVPVEPSAKEAKSLLCDIVLERGRAVSGIVVDPQGRPLSAAMACGLRDLMTVPPGDKSDLQLETANFTAAGLDARYPRLLIFYHSEKKLAKAMVLRGEEKGPLTVRLEALGTITGRLIDADGKPQRGGNAEVIFAQESEAALPEELLFGNHPLR